MPKLLSQSKHEEFKSNSTLQIKDQKERRAKCEEKHHCRKASLASTVPSSSTIPPAARSCFSRYTLFAFDFGFFPFYPCYYLPILVFFVTSLTLSIYISLSLYKSINSPHFGNNSEREAISPLLPFLFFFHFLSFSFPFSRLPNTPLRMTTQRMFV